MFGQLLMVLAGILALIGAGAFSYTYLEQVVPPHDTTQQVTQHISVINPLASAQKKVITKVVTPIKTNVSSVSNAVAVAKTVNMPGPLLAATSTVSRSANSSDLTLRGVIEYTNIARAQNGALPALTENSALNLDAQMKLNDMFAKQYFEHESPTKVGPADLARAVGYEYIVVGENLALGDFGGDLGVVTAWMNSTGHRANILNTHYQEIGVAVGKGMYKGYETWLAVQSFGMPVSACPVIDANLKAQIDANSATMANLIQPIEAKKAQIDSTPQSDPNYNTYANEFNFMIFPYNALVDANKINIRNYNEGVKAFNACIPPPQPSDAH